MIQAFVLIEAEPRRIQELVGELAGMQLAASVIKQVYAVTGRWDLIARVESPDLPSLGD
jgi:DNA-binding Lrp family transcriptional regulator